jgi:hypothetical protein
VLIYGTRLEEEPAAPAGIVGGGREDVRMTH